MHHARRFLIRKGGVLSKRVSVPQPLLAGAAPRQFFAPLQHAAGARPHGFASGSKGGGGGKSKIPKDGATPTCSKCKIPMTFYGYGSNGDDPAPFPIFTCNQCGLNLIPKSADLKLGKEASNRAETSVSDAVQDAHKTYKKKFREHMHHSASNPTTQKLQYTKIKGKFPASAKRAGLEAGGADGKEREGQAAAESAPPPVSEEEIPATSMTPVEIYNSLDQYVIGQERVKKILSVSLFNHFQRIRFNFREEDDDEVETRRMQDVGDFGGARRGSTAAGASWTLYNAPENPRVTKLDGDDQRIMQEQLLAATRYQARMMKERPGRYGRGGALGGDGHKKTRRPVGGGDDGDVELEKPNVLICGPTGTGKTLLAKTLAKMAKVPLVIADATSLTQAGYVGEDVESILLKLYQEAGHDLELAERGIVYIDEVDKIGKRDIGMSLSRDVSGEGVQQALLKLLEGSVVNVPMKRRNPNSEVVQMDTRNILFICGGAFNGLTDIIAKRAVNKGIGFNASVSTFSDNSDIREENDLLGMVDHMDLTKFGLISEFVGRFSLVVSTKTLTEDQFVQILTEPKNALVKQYKELFGLQDVEFHATEGALRACAQHSMSRGTGARGLRTIFENALIDAMFLVPSTENVNAVFVDEHTINNDGPAKLLTNDLTLEKYLASVEENGESDLDGSDRVLDAVVAH
jgi:ATP-dependent Clp protease ATP-binding subunit ClpX|eukprot:g715.t1